MSGAGQDVVIVVTDEGLGGVSYFARTIRSRGLRPVLITPPARRTGRSSGTKSLTRSCMLTIPTTGAPWSRRCAPRSLRAPCAACSALMTGW